MTYLNTVTVARTDTLCERTADNHNNAQFVRWNIAQFVHCVVKLLLNVNKLFSYF